MSCSEIRELFSARADEALTAAERAALDAHLATCAECAREWRRFEQTVSLVRGIDAAHAPAALVDRVLAARPRPWYRRLARGLLLPWRVKLPLEAAAIVLVASLAVLLLRGAPEWQQAARAPARDTVVVAPPETSPPTPPAEITAPRANLDRMVAPPAAAPPATPRELRSRDAQEDKLQRAGTDRDQERADAASQRAEPAPAGKAAVRQYSDERSPAPGASGVAPEPPRRATEALEKKAEGRLDQGRREAEADRALGAASSPAARATPRSGQVTLTSAPGVQGRLATADRPATERAVRELVTRAGGQVVSRAEAGEATVLALDIPLARWDEVRIGLRALGTLQLDTAGEPSLDPVRVVLRLER